MPRFIVAGLLALTVGGPAHAAATVMVDLWDRGGMMDMSSASKWGMGMHGDMKMAMMGVAVDKSVVPAGQVSFRVTNTSKETIHEMLVAPVENADVLLPYIANENRVDEEAYKDLGEVSELDPGKSGELTLDLKPGMYILFCNVPGHFMAGMWTTIEAR